MTGAHQACPKRARAVAALICEDKRATEPLPLKRDYGWCGEFLPHHLAFLDDRCGRRIGIAATASDGAAAL